jgi:hypothetical protein
MSRPGSGTVAVRCSDRRDRDRTTNVRPDHQSSAADGRSRFRTTRKEHRLTNTTSDKMAQVTAKEVDSVNAASGTASTVSGGQNPAAGPESMFDSLKRTILGIFKRPS